MASSDDPFGSLAQARQLAAAWGSGFHELGARGHINADSGLGDWDEGLALLRALISSHSSAADLFPGPDAKPPSIPFIQRDSP